MSTATESDKNLRVLIVSSDPSLQDEFRNALAGAPDRHAVVHGADSDRDAVEATRRRQPNVIVIEVDRGTDEIAALARGLHEQVPDAVILGALSHERLEHAEAGSAAIIDLLRSDVSDFLRRPIATTELRAVLDRLLTRPRAGSAEDDEGRVVAFLSNKGGVGKSTLAVNVACGLALRHPDDVLLIDTSLQIGACAMLLDLQPTTSLLDAVRERDRLDRTLLRHLTLRHVSGLRLLAAPADALEGSEVDDEAIARVVTMARRAFGYVVVDTFPMLDNVLMTVLDLADVAFVVVQGTAPAVAGAARLLPVLDGLGVAASRQRLVLNYNYKPFLGNLRPGDISGRLDRAIDHVVPYDKRVLVSTNTGSPRILHAGRWDRFGRAIGAIVDEVETLTASPAPDDTRSSLRNERDSMLERAAMASPRGTGR